MTLFSLSCPVFASLIKNTGTNLALADGNMELAGTANWVNALGSPTITKETTSPHSGKQNLKILATESNTYVRFGTMVNGSTYRMRGWARGTVTTFAFSDGFAGGVTITGVTASWKYFDVTYTWVSVNGYVQFSTTVGNYLELDDLQITKIDTGKITNGNKNLLVDGNMEAAGTTAWGGGTAAVAVTKETTSPHSGKQVLRITYVSGVSYRGQGILTIGSVYRVRGFARGDGVRGIPFVAHGVQVWAGTNSTNWQYFDVTFTASFGSAALWLSSATTAGDYVEFDDVTVTLEPSSKITDISKNLLVDGNMEATTTSSYLLYGAGSISKETASPHSGKRVLRVTGNEAWAQQNSLGVGTTYRIRGWTRNNGAASVIYLGNGGPSVIVGATTAWYYFDYVGLAKDNNRVAFYTSGEGYSEWDDVTITLVN